MYSVLDIINIAKISQYLCENDIDKRGLFGGGVDLLLPNKIYNIRKSVEWMYINSPAVAEVRALGYLNINSLGTFSTGSLVTVYVDDPDLGLIILGSYATQPSDTTEVIYAAHLVTALSTNAYGYTVTVSGTTITIEARVGLGGSINDDNRLTIIIGTTIFDNTFDNTFN